MNGHQTHSSDKVTYLGIVLDQYLNCKPHIGKVTNKLLGKRVSKESEKVSASRFDG